MGRRATWPGVVPRVASLPPPPDVPTAAQISEAVAAGVPWNARERATTLLAEQIVPWDLRGIETSEAPRRIAEVVYEGLVNELRPVAAARRGDRIETMACRTAGYKLLGDAMGLAIARWRLDHPGKAVPAPWDEISAPWAGRPAAELGAEADARLAEVARLAKDLTGDRREATRLPLLRARMALGAAKTGSFETATGSLVDFLHDVGASPQVLDVF
jgi:hypothetical protein